MKVELRKIDDVRPYKGNPRVNAQAVGAVAKSLKEFGFRQPIVVDKAGVIIVGHTRWKAAKKMGLAKVPVHVAKDLTSEQAKAYRLADNQTASLAEWDYDLLPIELKDLQAADFDLELLGFSEEELPRLLNSGAEEGLTDPDDIPEPPDKAVTQPGDLWVLGEHRLLCGDSTKVEDVRRIMGDGTAAVMVTDPPYGVAYETTGKNPRWRKDGRPIANDDLKDDQGAFWLAAFRHWPLKGDAYVFSPSGPLIAVLSASLIEAGIEHHQWLIWAKHQFVLGRSHYHYRHEHIFYGWKAKSSWNGSRTENSVWEADRPMRSPEHPTQKPVGLVSRAIVNSSKATDLVVDPFLGSGTTLLACEQLGRKCRAIEIEPQYVDVAVRRWEEFTGKKAARPRTAKPKKRPGKGRPSARKRKASVNQKKRQRKSARARGARRSNLVSHR